MPIIDLSNPLHILIALVLFVLTLFLAKETKRSTAMCIMLLAFLAIISGHSIEYLMIQNPTQEVVIVLLRSITMDYVFILLSFFAYLWTDEMECQDKKTKSVNNSLKWFWKKV